VSKPEDTTNVELSERMKPEILARLKAVNNAMKQLEGVSIPYNIIKEVIVPFAKWLEGSIAEENCLSWVPEKWVH